MELSHVVSSRLAWTMARGLNPSAAICDHMQVETTNPCGTTWNLSNERLRKPVRSATSSQRIFKKRYQLQGHGLIRKRYDESTILGTYDKFQVMYAVADTYYY